MQTLSEQWWCLIVIISNQDEVIKLWKRPRRKTVIDRTTETENESEISIESEDIDNGSDQSVTNVDMNFENQSADDQDDEVTEDDMQIRHYDHDFDHHSLEPIENDPVDTTGDNIQSPSSFGSNNSSDSFELPNLSNSPSSRVSSDSDVSNPTITRQRITFNCLAGEITVLLLLILYFWFFVISS